MAGGALAPPDAGVEGNARLTGTTGAVLILLLFFEGITILRVREMIGAHVFIGLMVVPPVLLKIASTGYRFFRYYAGREQYVRRGAPNLVLRATGPLVVVLTLVVLGSGIALVSLGPRRASSALAIHKASFVVWFAVMTLHVLAHLRDTARLVVRELRPRAAGEVPRGRAWRRALLALSLIAGVGVAAAVVPSASAWSTARHLEGAQPGIQRAR